MSRIGNGIILLLALPLGCGEDGAPPDLPYPGEPPTPPFVQDGTQPSVARDWEREPLTPPSCDATALCERTIEECDIDIDLADCLGWYANEANCTDMAGYLECNCTCLGQDTCDGYFGCGEGCYAQFC